MSWELLLSLLVKYGPEVVDFVVAKFKPGSPVSPLEWAELKVLADKTPESQLLDALARNKIDVNSEHAKNLLALLNK